MAYIAPTLWTPFIQEALQQKANILSMGLVTIDSNAPVGTSGDYMKIPIQSPLSTVAVAQRITSSTTLTPVDPAQVEEIGVVCHIGDSYKTTEVDKLTSGVDGLKLFSSQILPTALLGIQTYFASVAKGLFGTGGQLATTHTYNPDNETLSAENLAKGLQAVYGENIDSVDTIILHSSKYAELMIDNLIKFVPATDFAGQTLFTGTVPTYLGKKVVVNDTMCASYTDGQATKYPTYLTIGQPFYLGWQKTLDVKYDTDILTGGGKDILAWYVHFVPHVKGVSWTQATANPTTGNLETVGYWTKKQQDYNIGIMRINTL
jgi:hypothetical protein